MGQNPSLSGRGERMKGRLGFEMFLSCEGLSEGLGLCVTSGRAPLRGLWGLGSSVLASFTLHLT